MYHVNPYTLEKNECHAEKVERCPWYGGDGNSRHYETEQEAEKASQELKAQKYGDNTLVEYSFTKKFKQLEAEHNTTYNGLPTSFIKRPINQNSKGEEYTSELLEVILAKADTPQDIIDATQINTPYTLRQQLRISHNRPNSKHVHHLTTATSTPKDNQAPEQTVLQNLTNLGCENIQPLSAETLKKLSKKATRGYVAYHNNERLIVTDDTTAASKLGGKYHFRYSTPKELTDHNPTDPGFRYVDIRKIAGMNRIQNLTDENLLNTITNRHTEPNPDHPIYQTTKETPNQHNWNNYQNLRTIGATYRKLAQHQENAQAFQQQKQFITEQKSKIATVFSDKKHPDKTHQHMMETTPLNQHFKKVEIDNDVDPQEMQQFEQDYQNTIDKLPPIPANKKPALRIRKLGKHKAIGLYSANLNTIAIDVRDSSAFIHEYGHYLDLTVKNSQSTQQQFLNLRTQYKQAIWADNAIDTKQKEYYTTPTEIHSRMFEIYAHEKLGINNKLINPSRFTQPEYQPLNNPTYKAQYFDYFDTVFKQPAP